MEVCRICGNPDVKGYLAVHSASKTPPKVTITDEDKFDMHWRSNNSKQDLLNEYVDRGMQKVVSISCLHGNYCSKCWETEFEDTCNCMRCGKEEKFVSNQVYNVTIKSDLTADVSDLDSASLGAMRDYINRTIQNRVGWICRECVQSLLDHQNVFDEYQKNTV